MPPENIHLSLMPLLPSWHWLSIVFKGTDCSLFSDYYWECQSNFHLCLQLWRTFETDKISLSSDVSKPIRTVHKTSVRITYKTKEMWGEEIQASDTTGTIMVFSIIEFSIWGLTIFCV